MADVTLEIIIGLLILAIIAVIVIVTSGVKIVQPYQQAVYMRLGRGYSTRV
jgi:regulator of protease activity HflC (stomatin/prohibitin superfamily)